jgi:hypothetical protein
MSKRVKEVKQDVQQCDICGKLYNITVVDGIPDDELGIIEVEAPPGRKDVNLLIACKACRNAIFDTIDKLREQV